VPRKFDPRRADDEHERDAEAAKSAPPTPAPSPADALLSLQRTAGNQAVGAMLARNGPTGGTAAPTKSDADLYDDAVKAGDWDKAAELVTKLEWGKISDKLVALTADQLRLLDDALSRLGGIFSKRVLVRAMIAATLVRDKGVDEKKAAPGRAYGEIKAEVGTIKNGDKSTGAYFEYPIKVIFKPDKSAVNADEIAFIQSVRVVGTASGSNKSPYGTKRMTGKNTKVDRLTGREQGWYGYNDDDTPSGTVQAWRKADPDKEAWLEDTPSADYENTTYEFETAAVCKSGPDKGTVYAVLKWGFTTDSDLKVTGAPNKVFNKMSKEFSAAVDKWNEQAKGAAADRNAPGQKELPAVK
jgi:hypothetical protein